MRTDPKPGDTRPIRRKVNEMEVIIMDNAVTGQTLIGEIVNNHPEAIEILLSIGMHCLGCPASQMESLEEACAVHGIPADKVIDAINAKIAEAE